VSQHTIDQCFIGGIVIAAIILLCIALFSNIRAYYIHRQNVRAIKKMRIMNQDFAFTMDINQSQIVHYHNTLQ
jgi:predicted small secreted protein